MITHNQLFLFTVEDLRKKIAARREYEIIRACGLCRHLLTDNSAQPLVDIVNRKYCEKIVFEVADNSVFVTDKIKAGIAWMTIEPFAARVIFPNVPIRHVTKDTFLTLKLYRFNRHTYTVLEVINTASHIMGGVHSGQTNEKHQAMYYLNETMQSDEEITFFAMRAVCTVVLNALETLERKIKADEQLLSDNRTG